MPAKIIQTNPAPFKKVDLNSITLDIIDRTVSCKELCYTVDPKTQTSRAVEVPFERQRELLARDAAAASRS